MNKYILSAICGLLFSQCLYAQSVAFTFDDGPHIKETPLLSPKARNQAMLDALAKHQVSAALFVTVNNGANTPEGLAFAKSLGRRWSRHC